MPPRPIKRAGGGRKTPAKTAKGAKAVAEDAADAGVKVNETVKVEEVTTAVVKETRKEINLEELPATSNEESKGADANEIEEEEEPYEEEEEHEPEERLELEDNEPEYEAEEETAVDYDEQDMENEEEHEMDGNENMHDGDMAEEGEGADEDGKNEDNDGENEDERHEADHEIEEHHEVVQERRKRKEFEVFVGGLDKDATEEDLRKAFSVVGEINEVRLLKNPLTKKNKGFAFLRFATVEQAKRAVSELKAPMINGKQCGCAPSQDNDTLFVGNICKTWTKEHFKEKLKSFGVDNIEDLTLVEDTNNEGMNRGFAFLEFSARSDAMEAFRRLQKRDVFFGTDRNAKVSFADSFIEPDDEIMAQVTTIFIDGLPAAWDEDRVRDYLKKFGTIDKVELARNMPSAKRKDFGFVTFATHDSAVSCAEGINNKELGEGDNKVKVRARLSRPHQKGRGKYGSRGETRSGRGPPPRSSYLSSYSRPPPPSRRLPVRSSRPIRGRGSPLGGRGYSRPAPYREKRSYMDVSEKPRRLPPVDRSYDRRPPAPAYPKSIPKRAYSRRDLAPSRSRDVPPPRSRAPADYASRAPVERRPPSSYRDEYPPPRRSGYSEIPPYSDPRAPERRAYPEESYERKPPRPLPPSYREGRSSRDYDSLSGSKRAYSEMDDIPPRYPDASARHSRPRMEYDVGGPGANQYGDAYGERLGRTSMGYGSSRGSLPSHDGMYSSRHGMSYGEGSAGGSDVAGMYSSSYSSNYLPRGSDVNDSSYPSMYSGRNLSSSRYMSGSGPGSYY